MKPGPDANIASSSAIDYRWTHEGEISLRKRFQKGSLQKVRGVWVARWRQDGERKARNVRASFSNDQSPSAIAIWPVIVAPINSRGSEPSERKSFGDFVREVYLPFYRRKWKRSTVMTNEDRLKHHLRRSLMLDHWAALAGTSCSHCLIERQRSFIQCSRSSPVGSEADIRYGGSRGIFAEESGGCCCLRRENAGGRQREL